MGHPGDRLGPYRLKNLIGSGGMGQVFAAVHEHMDQEVALKLLSSTAAQDPQLVARLLQEARALARLQHPGVVRVHHCDRLDDGTVYLAMERLEGRSLRDWMRSQPGRAPLEDALDIGRRIAEVMADIHAKGIIHRDLKPENVFLCHDEGATSGFRLKLLDFGIAKVPPAEAGACVDTQVQTGAPILLGTAAYMAPEQCWNAAEVDGRADVYALGVLLFEMIAGQLPFAADDQLDQLYWKQQTDPPPLQTVVPELPGALSAFIASMLARAPGERPTMLRCQDMLGRPWEGKQDECPVPGLAPFTEAQAELFFGREAEIAELLGQLERAHPGERRWVQLEGPSGVGKSSLVQAGLLPRLKEGLPQDAPRWRIASVRPSYDPLRGLAMALVAAYAGRDFHLTQEQVERSLRTDPDALRALITAHTPPGCCLLLVLEQMEELFTIGAADCARLDELVSAALAAPDSPLRLLTTLRSDFIHRLEQMPHLERQLNKATRYHLRVMEEEALTHVIQGMAQRAGLRLSEGLATRMVREVRSEGSQLPLLGHALRGLWPLRSGALLTHEFYEQLGGVGGALARQAEQLLDGLGDEGREYAKWILLDLVQVGRGVPDTRRQRTRQEVWTAAGGDEQAEKVLMRLSGMRTGTADEGQQELRLIMLSGGPEPTQQRVDLVHETLLQKVPSLAKWIAQERAILERHAELEDAARTWEHRGRSTTEGLPSGTLLAHYRGHTDDSHQRRVLLTRTSDRARQYLEAAERLERRRTRARRALMIAALVAMAAIVLSAVLANRERRRAEESEHVALQARQEAERARQEAEANYQRRMLVSEQLFTDADWTLSRRAGTLKMRREMLQDAIRDLMRLPEQLRGKLDLRVLTIKAWHRMGDLAFFDDTLETAEGLLSKALEELRQGLEHHPEDGKLMFQLGLSHSKLGKVEQAREHREEARRHFEKSLEVLDCQSVKSANDDWRTCATSYSELGDLKLESGNVSEAAPLYDRAIELFSHAEKAGDEYDQALLAEAIFSRGMAALEARDLKAANGSLTRALARGKELARSYPVDLYIQWVLARIHVGVAKLRAEERQYAAAAGHYGEAQKLGRALRQGEPENKRYALVLSQSLLGDELLARKQGKQAHAGQVRQERCALVDEFVRKDREDVRFQRLSCR
jgi:tRNA A-37 threonylcarbamoyl transferase component Bud32/tetratricopeptide (TPR) repeat protein